MAATDVTDLTPEPALEPRSSRRPADRSADAPPGALSALAGPDVRPDRRPGRGHRDAAQRRPTRPPGARPALRRARAAPARRRPRASWPRRSTAPTRSTASRDDTCEPLRLHPRGPRARRRRARCRVATTASTTCASCCRGSTPRRPTCATRSSSSTRSSASRRAGTSCSRRSRSRPTTSCSSSARPTPARHPTGRRRRASSASRSGRSPRSRSAASCAASSRRRAGSITDDALDLIAQRAAGGMRDAESMLDQVVSSGVERDRCRHGARPAGPAPRCDSVDRFVDALAGGDALDGIDVLDELERDGRDLVAFCRSGRRAPARTTSRGTRRRRARRRPWPATGARRAPPRRASTSTAAAVGGYRWQLELALLDGAAPAGASQASRRRASVRPRAEPSRDRRAPRRAEPPTAASRRHRRRRVGRRRRSARAAEPRSPSRPAATPPSPSPVARRRGAQPAGIERAAPGPARRVARAWSSASAATRPTSRSSPPAVRSRSGTAIDRPRLPGEPGVPARRWPSASGPALEDGHRPRPRPPRRGTLRGHQRRAGRAGGRARRRHDGTISSPRRGAMFGDDLRRRGRGRLAGGQPWATETWPRWRSRCRPTWPASRRSSTS